MGGICEDAMPKTNDAKRQQKQYNSKYQRAWYKKNKKRRKKQIFDRRARQRADYHDFKASLSCEICGENHPATFDWHHVVPPKYDKVCNLLSNYSFKRLYEEINNCMLVCSNCHRKIHADRGKIY